MKKILVLLLVLALVFNFSACSKPAETGTDVNQPNDGDKTDDDSSKEPANQQREAAGSLTYGSNTDMNGNFFTSMWGNNAADAIIKDLIHGYKTVDYQKETGSYEIDDTVVKELKQIENADGTKTFEIEINSDLVYSDGSPITAKDYVFSALLTSHPEVTDIGANATDGIDYVGFEDYNTRPEGATEGQISDVFTGVRLLGDYKFSLTVKAENLPYFYDLTYAQVRPYPMAVIAPNADIVDEGNGAKITGEFTSEILDQTINNAETGYRFYPKVTAGAYMLDSFDVSTKIAVLKFNPNYKGDYNGQKPQVAQLIFKKINSATQIDELVAGTVDLLAASGGKDLILPGLDAVDAGKASVTTFPRCGYGKIVFVCDIGPTQFVKVRQAIAHCLDVPEFARQYSGGYASVVYGAYGVAQWMYQENAATIEKEFNKYALDLGRAEELLIEDGWTLNANGGEFVKGTDTLRHKMVDGKLMPLVIKHLASSQNPVSDLLSGMLPANMEAVGMKYEQTVVEFPVVLDNVYGNVPERVYNMMNMATGYYPAFDPYYTYHTDEQFMGNPNSNYLRDEQLMNLAKDLRQTPSDDREGYAKKWLEFQRRWNELIPDLPLYSDEYHAFFSTKVKNFEIDPFWTFQYAILYAYIEE